MSNLSGIARPGAKIGRALKILHPERASLSGSRALSETLAINALASVIAESTLAERTEDGRVDTRDVAARIVRRLGAPKAATLGSMLDDTTAITALARVLTEAWDKGLDSRETAAHVFHELRSFQQ